MSFKIIKRKAKGFFKPDDVDTIKRAVHLVHQIITDASILVRSYYLQWFDEHHPLDDLDNVLEVDKNLFTMACQIIQGKIKPSCRSEKTLAEKGDTFDKLLSLHNRLYSRVNDKTTVDSDLSLSYVIAYSIKNLLTAYENNVHCHFPKYPKRYIFCDGLKNGLNVTTARKEAALITNSFLYDFELSEELQEKARDYEFLFPTKMTVKELPRAWDLKVHPWIYLYKMVEINQMLETQFPMVPEEHRKLLNPLPFHSSFVPMHIRLDTSGLSQLLMNEEKIEKFKKEYEVVHGVTLKMESKADMLSSFEKLFGKKPSSNDEAGSFATDLWDYITNLKSCKQWKELENVTYKKEKNTYRFDNSVVTDGVSVSFQVIESSKFGRKQLKGRKKEIKEEDTVGEKTITDWSGYKLLACDPGKCDILTITDGYTTLCYTKGQRDHDTYREVRTKETNKRRRKSGLETYETQVMNRFTKRSCLLDVFGRYASNRKRKEKEFSNLYSHQMFREFKFTTYCRQKSSESRFAHKVQKTFKNASPQGELKTCMSQAMKDNRCRQATNGFIIGWGDWGRTTNMKNLAPTPGIGIRRRFEGWFKTLTINEHYTSQTCPCCGGEPSLKKATINGKERHHLLRCSNDTCTSRWWNRNVVGSFNILKKLIDMKVASEETIGSRRKRKQPLKSRT